MTTDDDKLAFYLKHWKQLEEWFTLRQRAVDLLDRELLDAVERLWTDSETPKVVLQKGSPRIAQLHMERATRDAWVELTWAKNGLFASSWPQIVVVWKKNLGNEQVRSAVKEATRDLCQSQGLTNGSESGWWVWSGEFRPPDHPFDIAAYADECVNHFRKAWLTLHGPIEEAVTSVLGPV